MSSLVQAKWTNSVILSSSSCSAMRSLMKYSTALTSWLVVRSISLMRSASFSSKSRVTPRRCQAALPLISGTSGIAFSWASCSSQLTSTWTR